MRIGFVSTMYGAPWGGSEELWGRGAALLLDRGHQVSANLFHKDSFSEPVDRLQKAGMAVSYRKWRRRAEAILGMRVPLLGARRWLSAERPDLVVLSLGYHTDGLEWMWACRERSVPYALLVQSAGEPGWPEDGRALALGEAYDRAEATLFVSRANRDFVGRQFAARLDNARIVWNPYNVRRDAEPPWPEGDEGLRLACVGRLHSASKGQDLILEVLRMEKWRNRPIHVSFYGSGPNETILRRLSETYGLSSVTFAGSTGNIEEVWRNHHALLLPSRYEGLPLVVVEAMLCHRPCIVTDVAGNREVIEDGVTGFLACAPQISSVDAALERAWASRDNLRHMGRQASDSIRAVLPEDPVLDFADLITGIAESARR